MDLGQKLIVPSGQSLARLPRPLVFTNGVFDVLHRGHVIYLAAARSLGNGLIVGVNSDASVRMLGKGPDRPINAEADRATVIAALESVSAVTIFAERTPMELLKLVRPEIYVKGGDYTLDRLPEAELAQSWGGRTVIIPFVEGYSTTELLARARSQ